MGTGPAAARAAAERAVARRCAHFRPPEDLLDEVAGIVRGALPYAAAGWMLSDPATGLTTAVHGEEVDPDVQRRLIEHERTVPDLNSFAALAQRRSPVGRLSAETRGRLMVSARHRRLYRPLGLGDEIRGVFRAGGDCWGRVCLTRPAQAPWFSTAEERSLARVSAALGAGLRQAHALAQACPEPGDPGSPAVLLLTADGRVTGCSDAARLLLAELPDDGMQLPGVVHEVAARARALSASGTGPAAKARVRGRAGRYLVVRGGVLDGGDAVGALVAVLLEPARRGDLAPLVMASAALTARERQVARLMAGGSPELQIARRLWLSPHTVHGYAKAVFAKLGVGSRAELGALLGEAVEPAAGDWRS
ncbi:LuxR C-terminal-related transcriptional regulator [Geodermatophilus sp. SYSU D00758]